MAKFMANGLGRWALYDNPSNNDAAFNNPRSNLHLVHAHSDFDYLRLPSNNPTITDTISIPGTVSNRGRTINLGAHGRGGPPFVFGHVRFGGEWVPLIGTVPVHHGQLVINGLNSGDLITWQLAVSNTHVYIIEMRTFPTFTSPGSRNVRIWVSRNVMD